MSREHLTSDELAQLDELIAALLAALDGERRDANGLAERLRDIVDAFAASDLAALDLDGRGGALLAEAEELLADRERVSWTRQGLQDAAAMVRSLADHLAAEVERVRDEAGAEVVRLEEEVRVAAQQLRTLEVELEQLRATSGSEREALTAASERISELEGEVERSSADQTELRNRIQAAEAEAAGANRLADERSSLLERRTKELQEEAQQARKDLEQLERDVDRRLVAARRAGARDAGRVARKSDKSEGKASNSTGQPADTTDGGGAASPADSFGLAVVAVVVGAGLVAAASASLLNAIAHPGVHLWFTVFGVAGSVVVGVGYVWAVGELLGLRVVLLCPAAALSAIASGLVIAPVFGASSVAVGAGAFGVILVVSTVATRKDSDSGGVLLAGLMPAVVLLAAVWFGNGLTDQPGDCRRAVGVPLIGEIVLPSTTCVDGNLEVAGVAAGAEGSCASEVVAYSGLGGADEEMSEAGLRFVDGLHLDPLQFAGREAFRFGGDGVYCYAIDKERRGAAIGARMIEPVESPTCVTSAVWHDVDDEVPVVHTSPPCDPDNSRLLVVPDAVIEVDGDTSSSVANVAACSDALDDDDWEVVARPVGNGRVQCAFVLS